jgi:hypothetical protein
MPAPGISLQGLVDTSDTEDACNNAVQASTAQPPTDSHALATTTLEDESAVQVQHGGDIVDLGWNEEPKKIASPLIGGIDNEDLWTLTRRFNKVSLLCSRSAVSTKQFAASFPP